MTGRLASVQVRLAGRRVTEQQPGIRRPPAHGSWIAIQQAAGNQAMTQLVRAGAGSALPAAVRAEMEAGFGRDFAGVRVHTGEEAAASALAEGARAYTAGQDIVFGAGRYAPQTIEGKRVLAHELAHVVQQIGAPGPAATAAAAEGEARQAASDFAAGSRPNVMSTAAGIQRDDLTDADRRRLSPADMALLRHWIEQEGHPGPPGVPAADQASAAAGQQHGHQDMPAAGKTSPALQDLPVISPPGGMKAPPGIARLGSRRKVIHVVEVTVPEVGMGPFGSTRMFSQADPVRVYNAVITQPDPSAGYNFDTYLVNTSVGNMVAAQYLGGTRFRVFMGSAECPGCHFGHGLEIDLHGQPFVTVMAEGLMNAMTVGDTAALLGEESALLPGVRAAEADEAARLAGPALRTADDEFSEFTQMIEEEGATEFKAAGEPVTMQPHGGASEARQTLGVSGEHQSMHGLPRSVGKHMPGYDPEAALTTLGEREMHTAMDRPWKDAFQDMRRQGRTTARAQEVYDAVADSIRRSPQLSADLKNTMTIRLHDEMFVEYGLAPGQQLRLPYPNIKPRP
jgi:hypothetical protein